jgi:hypothetical protein
MTNVEHGDRGEHQAVADSDQPVVQVGERERTDRDDGEMRDPREAGPYGGLPRVDELVYFFRSPFSS